MCMVLGMRHKFECHKFNKNTIFGALLIYNFFITNNKLYMFAGFKFY